MRKQFLLLLWLTLLPLAGWADTPYLTTTPTLKAGLIYNDGAQVLLDGDYAFPADYHVTQGGVRFAVTTTPGTPNKTGGSAPTWSANFPTATNAGTYYLWYYVLRDGGTKYNTEQSVQSLGSLVISRRNITTADFTFTGNTLTYTGDAQYLTPAATWTGGKSRGSFRYALSTESYWNNNRRTATNAGTYTVELNIRPDENHLVNGSTSENLTFTSVTARINQATTVVTPPTARDITFNGNWQQMINAGSTNFGTLYYQAPNSRYTGNQTNAANIQGGNAGTYTVNYFVTGTANYTGVSGSITVTLKQAVPTINKTSGALATGLVYKGDAVAQQLVTTEYTCTTGGSVRYHISYNGGAIGSAINGITNVKGTQPGTYSIYYSIVAASNNYAATAASTETKLGDVIIEKAELAASAKSAEKEYDGTPFNDPSAFYSVGSSPKFLNGETAAQQAAILAKLFTVTGYAQTDAGTYDVNVKSKDADDVPYTISPMIEENAKLQIKKTDKNDWTTPLSIAASWYYGTTPATPSVAAKFVGTDEPTIKYYEEDKTTEVSALTASTGAGKYFVKAFVAETANYNGLESDFVEFNILPADPSWATTPAMAGWEYTKYSAETNTPAGAVAYSTTYTYKYFQSDGTTEIPAADLPTLGVGNYYAQVIAAATDDYVEKASPLLGFTVTPTTLPTIAFTFDAVPYKNDASSQKPTDAQVQAKITEVTPADYTLSYTDKDGNAVTEFVDAGTYYVVITGQGNYAKEVSAGVVNFQKKAFVIEPVDIAEGDIVTKANNLTYQAADLELIQPATFKDGISKGDFTYAVVAKGEAAPADAAYKADIPTGYNAGEYTVYTKFSPDANHNGIDVDPVDVKILPVTLGYMLSNLEKTWTGKECTEEEVEETYSLFVGALQGDDLYNPPFTLSLPATEEKNFIDAGSYELKKLIVTWADENVKNYKINWSGTGEVLINKADIDDADFIAPVAAELTYNTQAQNLVKEGYEVTTLYKEKEIGEIQFATAKDGTYSTTVPTATNVSEFDEDGKLSVWYKVKGDDNHNDTEPVEITATMVARSWSPVLAFENIPNAEEEGVYGKDYMPTDLSVKDQLDAETLTALVEGTDYTLAITKDGEEYTGEKLEDVGTYVFTFTAQGNYKGDVDRTITIKPATFEAPTIAAVPYNGAAQKPDYAIAGLTEGTDYTVEVVADDDTWTNAGEYVINYTGIGNYAGTAVSTTYEIEKLEVIAEASDASKVYDGIAGIGDTEVTITYNGLLTGEPEDAIVAGTGAIKAVNDEGEESEKVGTYKIVLDPEKFVSTNYTVLAGDKAATFTITAPQLAVMWNDEFEIPEGEFTKVYGAEEPELKATADNVILLASDSEYKIPSADVSAIIAATVITRADLDKQDVGTYDVELSGKADAEVLKNYNVQFFKGEGVFTITPATLKVSLAAQDKVYDGNPAEVEITTEDLSVAGLIGEDTKDVIDVTKLTAVFADDEVIMAGDYQFTLALADEAVPAAKNYTLSPLPSIYTIKPLITISPLTMKVGEDVDAFLNNLEEKPYTIEGVAEADLAAFGLDVAADYLNISDGIINADPGTYEDGLVIIAIDTDVASKYKGWDEVTGKLIVVPEDPIILSDTEPFTNDDVKEGVTVTFADRKINADTWNVMVLPFETTPGEISDAFGFAAVDVLNKASNNPKEAHFNLITSGTIPAGQPFIVKPTSDYKPKANFNEVFFYNVNIEVIDGENTYEEDAAGNKFWGTFQETKFYGEGYWYMSKGKWYTAVKYTESNPVTLKPFRAYVEFADKSAEARIFVEEPDGTVTAIDAVTFNNNVVEGKFNLNGVKVNNANRKGVFIQNGKKVINK